MSDNDRLVHDQQSAAAPSEKTFQQAFSERFHCPLERFESKVFWKCLYRRALPVAALLFLVKRDFFDRDFKTIRRLAKVTTAEEVLAEATTLRLDYWPGWQFLRRSLRVRLSGKRLGRLATLAFR